MCVACGFADANRKGNMKKISSAKAAFILFGIMTFASISGAVSSSLAWYAYSTRALVSYSGTSVSDVSLLQIGICSDVVVPNMPSNISHITFAGDLNHYYFSETGKGLTYDIITNYLSLKGFATNELSPTTSGSFATGNTQDSFSLKKSPNELVRGNTIAAEKENYLTIPLVFRIQGEDDSFFDDKELWLTKAVAKASSGFADSEVYKAIRVFVDRDSRNYSGDFIFNPSISLKGETRVGGLLNLSRDEYYDYDSNGEMIYGEYDPAALSLISSSPYEGLDVIHDVNGVGSTEASTFVAKHHPNTEYYTNFYSAANNALFGHAEYESISSIAPARDEQDNLTNVDPLNPTSVCKTRADDHHLGRVNLTVYLEGWDFSVVDKEISHGFDLGLTFEMSHL